MDLPATGLRPAVEGPYDWGPAMSARQERLRLTAALATSAAFHLVALVVLLHSARVAELLSDTFDTPRAKLIPVSLVSRAGGGGGEALGATRGSEDGGGGIPARERAGDGVPGSGPPPPPPASETRLTGMSLALGVSKVSLSSSATRAECSRTTSATR